MSPRCARNVDFEQHLLLNVFEIQFTRAFPQSTYFCIGQYNVHFIGLILIARIGTTVVAT